MLVFFHDINQRDIRTIIFKVLNGGEKGRMVNIYSLFQVVVLEEEEEDEGDEGEADEEVEDADNDVSQQQ